MSHLKLSSLAANQESAGGAMQTRLKEGRQTGNAGPSFAAMMLQNGAGASTPASPYQSQFEDILGDNMGLSNARAMATLAQLMDSSTDNYSTLDTLRNVINSNSVLTSLSGRFTPAGGISGPGLVAGRINHPASGHKGKHGQSGEKSAQTANANSSSGALGSLAARFESGGDGVAAIGYDRHGGTSYGKFQLSSRAGTMDSFVSFLQKEAPAWAKRLSSAGPANTGGRSGSMPKVWKELAAENPAMFEELQTRFVHNNHFQPAVAELGKRTGLDFNDMSPAMREVLWSTAVQHGVNGAARLFTRAVKQLGEEGVDATKGDAFEKALITKVYALRSGQFGSSEARVQNAVMNRLVEERDLALAMVNINKT